MDYRFLTKVVSLAKLINAGPALKEMVLKADLVHVNYHGTSILNDWNARTLVDYD